jgi:hypothetical protein
MPLQNADKSQTFVITSNLQHPAVLAALLTQPVQARTSAHGNSQQASDPTK